MELGFTAGLWALLYTPSWAKAGPGDSPVPEGDLPTVPTTALLPSGLAAFWGRNLPLCGLSTSTGYPSAPQQPSSRLHTPFALH
jgi:hypothetical protein